MPAWDRRRPIIDHELIVRVSIAWIVIGTLFVAAGHLPQFGPGLRGGLTSALLIPLATLAVTLLLVGRITWRLTSGEATTLACMAMLAVFPLALQYHPGNGGMLACSVAGVLLALNGLMARSPVVGGWLIGTGYALAMNFNPATSAIAAATFALLAARWLREPPERSWLIHSLVALAFAGAAGVYLRAGSIAAMPDVGGFSIAHCAAAAAAGTGLWALAHARRMPGPLLVMLMLLIVAVGAGVGLIVAHATGSGFPLLLATNSPLWACSAGVVVQTIAPPALGLFAAVQLCARSHGWLQRWWRDYAILLTVAALTAIADTNVAAVAGAVALAPIGWQLREWIRQVRTQRTPIKRYVALAGMAGALFPAVPVQAINALGLIWPG